MREEPIVVVGAGPAGCAAAVQCARLGVRPLLLDRMGEAGGLVRNGYLIDKRTGKILTSQITKTYQCTRFSLAEPYLLGCSMDVHDLSNGSRLVSTGPRLDPSECTGAIISNGRLFYTGQGGGMQACQVYGAEAESFVPPWRRRADR